jgi:phosphatidylglycerophosphatase C
VAAAALALFDLDGTLTRRDTLAPYVFGFLAAHPRGYLGLPDLLPTLARFVLGRAGRGALKASFLRATLGGRSRAELTAWSERFVSQLLRNGFFAQALSQVAMHREARHRLVLLSASTDLYVPRLGEVLGFDQVVCTGVKWAGDRLAGDLATPNRRGQEKVRVLQELRTQWPGVPVIAYGNAASDVAHLRLAEQGFLVNGNAHARRVAASVGVPLLSWR